MIFHLFFVLLNILFGARGNFVPNSSVIGVATDSAKIIVSHVTDGDTIRLQSGEKVRLIGIDTPETVDPRRAVGCFGKQASEFTTAKLLNQEVVLEKDVSETDRYGRLLRYIWLQGELFNEILVRQGYAYAVSYPPDVKYQTRLKAAQILAQKEKLGLWSESNCPKK